MPFIDMNAKRRLIDLREELGHSPESLAQEIGRRARVEGWACGSIDPYTIRRAERGFVPSIRTRFVLAKFFGVSRGEIWNQDAWVKVDGRQKVMA